MTSTNLINQNEYNTYDNNLEKKDYNHTDLESIISNIINNSKEIKIFDKSLKLFNYGLKSIDFIFIKNLIYKIYKININYNDLINMSYDQLMNQ